MVQQVTGIYVKVYEELMELMANNFTKFRSELRSAPPPCIPYLGSGYQTAWTSRNTKPDTVPIQASS